eukprot:774887-Amphidinium_carterae.1
MPKQCLGSHSLKATLLAWGTRFRMKASTRRVLGKHSDRKDHSMLIYSRDVCLASLQAVAEMFLAILKGEFDPDASRSVLAAGALLGHCRKPDDENAAAGVAHVPGATEPDDHGKDSEHDEEEGETSSSIDVASAASDQSWCEEMFAADANDESDYVLNVRSGCLHKAEAGLTSCGLSCKDFEGFADYFQALGRCTNTCARCFRV